MFQKWEEYIGWGHVGRLWNKMTFVIYVRQSRFTKELLEKNGAFTISCFLDQPDPKIFRICVRINFAEYALSFLWLAAMWTSLHNVQTGCWSSVRSWLGTILS